MALPKLEGIYTVETGDAVSVTEIGGGGTSSVTLTAGDYSISGLCTHLGIAITTNATLSGVYSCTVADGTDTASGKVTITATGITSFTLTWTTAAIGTALGFSGTLTPTALTFTATSATPWMWLPNTGRSDALLTDGDEGKLVRPVAINVSTSGDVYSWASAASRYENVLEFTGLKGYKVARSLEVTANESLEAFFETVVSKGIEFRYYVDRSDDETYVGCVAKQGSAESFEVSPQFKAWRGAQSLWSWRCEVYSTGAVSPSGWTPASLALTAWYRSDLGVTITGSGVSTWADQSGNGHHATQTTDAYRPPFTAGAINGHAALSFDDAAVSHLLLSGITVPASYTVWVMLKLTSGLATVANLLYNTTTAPTVQANDPTNRPSLYYTATSRSVGATTIGDGIWRSMRWMRDGTSLYHAYSSNAHVTEATQTSAGSWSIIGAGASQSFDGQIAEVIITGAALTSDEIVSLNAYRLARYGL